MEVLAMAGRTAKTSGKQSAKEATGERSSMDSHRPGVTNFVHIGLVVEDLDETVRFLALLDVKRSDVLASRRHDQVLLAAGDGRSVQVNAW
jgi:hypothetical protein